MSIKSCSAFGVMGNIDANISSYTILPRSEFSSLALWQWILNGRRGKNVTIKTGDYKQHNQLYHFFNDHNLLHRIKIIYEHQNFASTDQIRIILYPQTSDIFASIFVCL